MGGCTDKDIYTAGVLIIGNEILSGRTQDSNSKYIAGKLSAHGIRLMEIRVIPDIEARIIEAVNGMRSRYTYVFTTGGIGPTHDDITAVCIAKAFDVSFGLHEEAHQILLNYYGAGALTDARKRMACIPDGALLIPNPVSGAPGFIIGNVYVMAGVPKIMEAMFDHILPQLKGGAPILSRTITCSMRESEVAGILTDVQDQYPDVDIGSYPHFKDGIAGLSVVVRTDSAHLLKMVSDIIFKNIIGIGGDPIIMHV